jgi:sulfate-transporting ATPase
MIVGQEQPDDGALTVGQTVKMAYVDQSRETLDGEKTVWQEISGGEETLDAGQAQGQLARLRARFNFAGRRPAEEGRHALRRRAQPRASGQDAEERGQRAAARRADQRPGREHAARAGRGAAQNFAGCAVVISHDRWFLDRVATHILAFEGDSQVYWYPGNYSEYEEDKKQATGRGGRAAASHQLSQVDARVIPDL